MKKRGSAIIIAMLLIAAIGAVAFGIGRLIYIETGTAELYENGIVAYYAAESGIEEGFLRYRFDRNSEVPTSFSFADAGGVFRSNLTDGSVSLGTAVGTLYSGVLTTDLVSDRSKIYYDVRMGYLGTEGKPWYGRSVVNTVQLDKDDTIAVDYSAGKYKNLSVEKDNALKIDLTNYDFDGDLKLILAFYDPTGSFTPVNIQDKCKAMAELELSVSNSAGVKSEYKELTSYDANTCFNSVGVSSPSKLYSLTDSSGASTDFKYFYYMMSDLGDIFARAGDTVPADPKSIVLTVRPLYYKVNVALYRRTITNVNCSSSPTNLLCTTKPAVLSGPFSYITSRGYHGGVTRTITADIDRQSGTLYDLFDYVIFKDN